jgi:hypothetical protein
MFNLLVLLTTSLSLVLTPTMPAGRSESEAGLAPVVVNAEV